MPPSSLGALEAFAAADSAKIPVVPDAAPLELLEDGFDLGYFVALSPEPLSNLGSQPIERVRVRDESEAQEFLEHHLAELLKEARADDEFPFEEVL